MSAHRVRLTSRLLKDARAQEQLYAAIREEHTILSPALRAAVSELVAAIAEAAWPPWRET